MVHTTPFVYKNANGLAADWLRRLAPLRVPLPLVVPPKSLRLVLSFYYLGNSSMDDESRDAAYHKARDVVQPVEMPRREPDRMWGGPSLGGDCAVCGFLVRHGELELEIEFDGDGDRQTASYRVHVPCLAVWRSSYREHIESPRVDQ
jgi:hypothetical protein